jgi:hypothetical protein
MTEGFTYIDKAAAGLYRNMVIIIHGLASLDPVHVILTACCAGICSIPDRSKYYG